MMPRLGKVTLGDGPALAIAIQDDVAPEAIAQACKEAIVELRLDALPPTTPEAYLAFVSRYSDFPRLITIRHSDEGGGWRGSESERLNVFRSVMPDVDAVDIEIAVGTITKDVVEEAHALKKLVIGSYHDFEATPDADRLEWVHDKGREAGVDIVKVAARCENAEDARRLAAFTLAHREDQVIVVGMGPFGLASRIFFPALGSLLTYTFLGQPTAPGQLNCVDTLKYLSSFYPQGVAKPSDL